MQGARGATHEGCAGRGPRASRRAIVVCALALSLFAPCTRAAAKPPFFGVGQAAPLEASDLKAMASARVRTDRFLVYWGSVQPTRGSFNWGPTDGRVGTLASHGIRTVPALWGNPDWVGGSSATPPVGGPRGEHAWQAFLKAAVKRYGPGGSYWLNRYHQQFGADATPLPIQSWQIWNEPNLKGYFAPHPSAGRYARLLQISHSAIKSQDPRAQIVLAGMPGWGDVTAWGFLSSLYSVPGIRARFDVVALHPYARDLDHVREAIGRVRGVMANHGDQTVPLWLTEFAWGSAPPDRFGINKGPTGQGQMLSDSFKLILNHRSAWNVQRLFWYRLRDPAHPTATCSFCASAGLLKPNRTPKPAYAAFKRFTAERILPQVRITSGPGQGIFTGDSTPTLFFSSNEPGSTFRCRFGAGPFSPCSSPFTRGSPLSDGPHTFLVRAIDAAGNVSAPASRSFTVDTQAPDVTISSGPGDGSTSSHPSPSFAFDSNEASVSFACRLDGEGFGGCASPFTASGLADGPHTFQVRATDRAGNQGSTISRTWTVDATGPGVWINDDPTPGSVTKDPTPSFGFSSPDSDAGFRCRIDGGSWAGCSSPYTASSLSDGGHTFTVQAMDAAQNTDLASREFAVDTSAPEVTIEGESKLKTTKWRASASFALGTSERAGLRCRIDSNGFRPCLRHYRTPKLRRGTHMLKVEATDGAGNVGADHKRFEITRKQNVPPAQPTGPSSRPDVRCHGISATLIGSRHGDRLRGTTGPDVIVGLGGNDTINGRGGDDLICGRRGADEVIAGSGDDRIFGGHQPDYIRGGAGHDMTRGGSGFDFCGGAPPSRTFRCERSVG